MLLDKPLKCNVTTHKLPLTNGEFPDAFKIAKVVKSLTFESTKSLK